MHLLNFGLRLFWFELGCFGQRYSLKIKIDARQELVISQSLVSECLFNFLCIDYPCDKYILQAILGALLAEDWTRKALNKREKNLSCFLDRSIGADGKAS